MKTLTVEFDDFHPAQFDVVQNRERFSFLRAGRRWGKTRLGVAICVDRVLEEPGGYFWATPTYPLAEEGWEVLSIYADAIPRTRIEEAHQRVRFPGGGWVQIRSADRPYSLRSRGLRGVVLDEAAFMKPAAWTAVRPSLTDFKGWALFISSPNGMNWFYDLEKKNVERRGWTVFHYPSWTNPALDREEIEEARLDLGETLFRQEYGAEYLEEVGTIFKRETFHYFTSKETDDGLLHRLETDTGVRHVSEKECRRFAMVDLAASQKTSADWTVCAVWDVTPKNELLLLDVIRDRLSGPDQMRLLGMVQSKWRPTYFGIERVAYQLTLVQWARDQGLPVREVTPDRDKVSRALPAAARYEGGSIFHSRHAPWLDAWELELLAFPEGRWDDQVDVVGYAVRELTSGWYGGVEVVESPW